MNSYVDKRLEQFRGMSTEEVAATRIRTLTHPRVKAAILAARDKIQNGQPGKKAGGASNLSKGLKDGDVLLLRNKGTLAQNLIAGVTRSPYTHAAVYSRGKVYDSLSPAGMGSSKGATGGGNINTLEGFAERDAGSTYDVFRPKDRKAAREAARHIEKLTTETIGYSYGNAVQAGLRDRFGFGITTNHSKNFKICSELVYDCFNGAIGADHGQSVSPGRLAKNQNLERVHSLKLSLDDV